MLKLPAPPKRASALDRALRDAAEATSDPRVRRWLRSVLKVSEKSGAGVAKTPAPETRVTV
jgi:hypothetical protein